MCKHTLTSVCTGTGSQVTNNQFGTYYIAISVQSIKITSGFVTKKFEFSLSGEGLCFSMLLLGKVDFFVSMIDWSANKHMSY